MGDEARATQVYGNFPKGRSRDPHPNGKVGLESELEAMGNRLKAQAHPGAHWRRMIHLRNMRPKLSTLNKLEARSQFAHRSIYHEVVRVLAQFQETLVSTDNVNQLSRGNLLVNDKKIG